MNTSAGVRLQLLGLEPGLRTGADAPVRAGRLLALLAYLYLGPPEPSRDELAEILWDPEPGADAQHRLRELLSAARRALPKGALISRGRHLYLDRTQLACDVTEFREAASRGCPAEAAAIYQADFLTGAIPTRARLFEEWADGMARSLRREFELVLDEAVRSSSVDGRHSDAARFAERLWRIEPDDEERALTWIRALSESGDAAVSLAGTASVEGHFLGTEGVVPAALGEALADARSIPRAVPAEADIPQPESRAAPDDYVVTTPHGARPVAPRATGLRWVLGVSLVGLTAAAWSWLSPGGTAPEAPFGGGGTLLVSAYGGPPRALRFVGPLPTDTVADGTKWSNGRLSPWAFVSLPRGSVAAECHSRGSNDRPICERDFRGGETRVLWEGVGDNYFNSWSPDGQAFLMSRDAEPASPGNRYVWLASLTTGEMRLIEAGTGQTTGYWSPDGTRVAIQSALASGDSLHIVTLVGDSLLAKYGLPTSGASILWSPDGSSLLVYQLLSPLRSPQVFVIRPGAAPAAVALPQVDRLGLSAWSPDGTHVAVSIRDTTGSHVRLCAPPRCDQAALVIPGADAVWWIPDETTYLDTVEVRAAGDSVMIGGSVPLSVRTVDPGGRPTNAQVLSVEVLGGREGWVAPDFAFHPLKPGRANIVVSAGGWRADTVMIDVLPAPPPRLVLREGWDEGIDSTVWKSFGDPLPTATPSGQGRALRNNGDSLYPSGVVARATVQPSSGLSLEWRQRTPLTGDLWQEVWIHFSHGSLTEFREGPGDPYPYGKSPFSLNLPVLELVPPVATTAFGCGGDKVYVSRFPEELGDDKWHDLVFQLLPDGRCLLFADGILLGTATTSNTLDWNKPMRLWIGGRTYRTDILIDDVELWQGVRWVPDASGRVQAASPGGSR